MTDRAQVAEPKPRRVMIVDDDRELAEQFPLGGFEQVYIEQ